MKFKASLIAKSTSINPKLVPLPDNGENFLIIYTDFYGTTDSLFIPPSDLLNQLLTERNIVTEDETSDGKITVIYSIPSNDIHKSIRKISYIFILAFIFEIILAVLLGYWISGKLIKPIKQVIQLADSTDLQNNTKLLTEFKNEDELKELITSFNRMLIRIKEQSDLQNTFFASASHELRTPLSIMQTRLQVLLLEKSISNEVKQAYTEQLTDVKRMISMVNDFLLLSELQNGNIQTARTECSLPDMLTTIISKNKEKRTERDLNFKISFTPVNESYCIEADEEKLYIILNNLIINSLKYSETNSIITIHLKKTETGQVVISISNKIIEGINPDLSAVKESFYHSKPRHGEGSGLGLWIANRLSELQNFTLSTSMSDGIFEVILYI